MPYLHTVYNELHTSIDHYLPSNYLIFSCIVFLLIVCLTYLIPKILGRNKEAKKREEYQINSLLVIFLEIVFFVIFLKVDKQKPNFHHRTEYLFNSSQLKIVEGYVADYYPMSKDDHGDESFKVKGVDFHYSFYEEGTVGYHLTANHGGMIKPNLYVKILYWYDGDRNAIIKLETE